MLLVSECTGCGYKTGIDRNAIATISQDLMSQDPRGIDDASSIAFSQADRLRRAPSAFGSEYKAMAQDDDTRSQVSLSTQITDF